MNAKENTESMFFNYQLESAADGYPFACDCGEMYKSDIAAVNCRKCRTYLMDEDFEKRQVVHVPTGEVIWSAEPGWFEKMQAECEAAEEARVEAELKAAKAPVTHNPFAGLKL